MRTTRKRLSVFTGLAGLLLVAGCSEPSLDEGPARPRAILLISIDTLRADYLNAYGYARFQTTPCLDAFAAQGVLFENAFIQEPRTLTSHMSLFTGLYPQHHRVQDETSLAPDIPTLAMLLRDSGYRTQAFVDGGYLYARWGFDRGFDGYTAYKKRGFEEILPAALDWLERHGDEPFFLFLHTYDVHSEGADPLYVCPPPFQGTFTAGIDSQLNTVDELAFAVAFEEKEAHGGVTPADVACIQAAYAEGVRHVDAQIEKLFARLKELGLYDDMLIVVWSDHGEGLYDHAHWSHGELFDHTLRVPLLMRIPGGAQQGQRIASVVSSIDLMPTLLELAAAPIPAGLDGTSLLPILATDAGSRDSYGLRTKKDSRLFSIRSRRYHYIEDEKAGTTYFYDLQSDPEEQRNLFPSALPEERVLAQRLQAWIAEHDAAWRLGEPPVSLPLDASTEERLRALGYLGDGDGNDG